MGFYPFLQVTSGFIVRPYEPYASFLQSLFPGVPKTWFHSVRGSLVVFPPNLIHAHGGFDSHLSGKDYRRGCLYWKVDTKPTTSEEEAILKQLNDMARACGATVRALALELVSCSLDGFASPPALTGALPVVTDHDAPEVASIDNADDDDDIYDDRTWERVRARQIQRNQEAMDQRHATAIVKYVPPIPRRANPQAASKESILVDTHALWPIIQASVARAATVSSVAEAATK